MTAAAMRAVRLYAAGERPRLVRMPVPEPGPGEVRIAVRACGICGSDVHLVEGTTATGQLPLTLGHESAGIVDALGPGVTTPAPGRRVAVTAGYGCGQCRACGEGAESICPRLTIPGIHTDGGQAGYLVVPARAVLPLPDAVDFAIGAILTDAVATPFHAIRRNGVRRGDTAVVYGLGGLGLHAAAILDQVVGAHVIGVDSYPGALERAGRFGVTTTVDAARGRPAAAVRQLTGGGADASFEFVGSAAVVDQAVKSLRPGGVCTVAGVGPEPLSLVPQELLVAAELTVQGSFGSTAAEVAELLQLVATGALDLTGTITHRFGLESFDEALRVLETKSGDPIRVVVEQPG